MHSKLECWKLDHIEGNCSFVASKAPLIPLSRFSIHSRPGPEVVICFMALVLYTFETIVLGPALLIEEGFSAS